MSRGLTSLDKLRERCDVDERGCWDWTGPTRRNGTEAVVWMPTYQRAMTIQRAAMILAGKQVRSTIWRTCCNPLCCNPAHMGTGSWAQYGEWKARAGVAYRGPGMSAAVTHGRRRWAKLTLDDARAIRASDKTNRELAAELGVSTKTIWLVRSGKTWRDTAKNASVFAWAA